MSGEIRRHTRRHPCECCGGYDELQRGIGLRCWGFTVDGMCFCTRENVAGALTMHGPSQTFGHRLNGPCQCGVSHEQAAPVVSGPMERRSGTRRSESLGQLVERYVYRDAGVRPVHATLRYEPKGFLQQRYEHGQWVWGLGGIRLALYHLPELLTADPSLPVFVTEGEADCERLLAFGLVATTNACGTAWRKHYAEWLRGRRVVIVEDNDDPGRERTRRITTALHGVAASVRVIGFSSMPEHSDVSDWIAAGGNPHQFLAAVAS